MKIYFVAVNWSKMQSGTENTYLWLREHDTIDGCDIAQWVEGLPYSNGWRLYPFTKKKDRELVIQRVINGWLSIRKQEEETCEK